MKGIIGIWSGAVVDIPLGWQLCNGTNGTPDLRNNFVLGAGSSFAVDETGGSLFHNHDFTGDGHSHSLVAPDYLEAGTEYGSATSEESAVGTTDAQYSLPPFYALCFIQKM